MNCKLKLIRIAIELCCLKKDLKYQNHHITKNSFQLKLPNLC